MFADDQGLCGTNVFDVHHVAGRSVQGRMGSALEIPVLQALAPQARGDEAVAWQRGKADVRAACGPPHKRCVAHERDP